MPDRRKQLVSPLFLTDDEYAQKWMNEEATTWNGYSENLSFYTERGEYVRSKSENIIADKLFLKNIPYKYEITLSLSSGQITHPDFTVLNKRTRKVFYWEHFGMMDNPDYANSAVNKIHEYEKNGYLIGDKFIVTFETQNSPLDTRALDSLINTYFL